MSSLIDTDVVINYLAGRAEARELVAERRKAGLSVSVITLIEVAEGIESGRRPEFARKGLRAFLRRTRVLVVSRPIAERAAKIRVDLRHHGRQVNERTLDIIIAATAIEHKLTLVTRNTRHYADIDGLDLYDWTS